MAVKFLASKRLTALSTDLVTVTPQGYAGGNATSSTQSAGGGGAGGTATGSGNKNGGIGKVNPIVGSTHGESSGGSYYLAGGGGGAGEASGASTGGLGGGGNGGTIGTTSTEATSGYGGGAGGGGNSGTNYPNGASGVVILKLLTSSSFSSSNATSSTTGSYTILTYTSTSSSSFTISSGTADVQYLVVAGGGASKDNWGYAGGGGAGGFITGTKTALASGTYTVSVGAGGVGAGSSTTPANGGNSVFSDITSLGGGGAGSWIVNSGTGFDGGSGGGAQGNSGGNDVGGSGATYSTPKLGTTDTITYGGDDITDIGTFSAVGSSGDTFYVVEDTTNKTIDVKNAGNSGVDSSPSIGYIDLGSSLSSTAWVLRYKLKFNTMTAESSGGKSFLTSFGIVDEADGAFGTGTEDGFKHYFIADAGSSQTQFKKLIGGNDSDWVSMSWTPTATTIYVEMKFDSGTCTTKFYSDEFSTQLSGTSTVSKSGSFNDLRYFQFVLRQDTGGNGVMDIEVSDLKIYDGVTSATPTDNAVTVPNGSVAEETDTGKHRIWNSTTSAWVEVG